MEVDFCDEYISVSKYPLSASNAIGKIINAYEDAWNIWLYINIIQDLCDMASKISYLRFIYWDLPLSRGLRYWLKSWLWRGLLMELILISSWLSGGSLSKNYLAGQNFWIFVKINRLFFFWNLTLSYFRHLSLRKFCRYYWITCALKIILINRLLENFEIHSIKIVGF